MSASLDEAQYNFTQDAPNSVITNFYVLVGDNAYGYSFSSTNLSLNILGDIDTYAIHLNPGHSYTIIANSITPYGGGNSNPSFVINDVYNNVLAASSTYGGTASYTGTALYDTYFIKVFTAYPGYYALRIEDNSIKEINGVGETIIAGKNYNAALDYASDVDHYVFYAVSGHTYTADIKTTIPDLFLKIFNVTTNAAVTAVTNGGIWTFTPSETGTYDLAISSNSFYNTGAYSFVAMDTTSIGGNSIFSPSSNPIPSNAPSSAVSILSTGLDSSGNAFGYYTDNANHTYGFTVANGSFQAVNVPSSTLTKVTGTSSTGILGFYYDSAGTSHGFTKNQSQITTTDHPLGFYGTWLTTGNSTQAAGAYCDAAGQLHGYIQTFSNTGSPFTTVNNPLGVKGTWVTTLSSDGKAAGFYIDGSNTYHGFAYQSGIFTNINVASSIHTIPIGINSSGQVVGEYMDAKGWHGFLYSNGNYTPYDYANASLTAFTGINDSGNIVGIATVGTSTQSFATHILG